MHKQLNFFNIHFSTFRSKLTAAFILTSIIPLLLSIIIALYIINSYLSKDSINMLYSDAKLDTQQIETKLGQIIDIQNSLSTLCCATLTPDHIIKNISQDSLTDFQDFRENITSIEYIYKLKRIRIYSDFFPFTRGDSIHFFPLDELDPAFLQEISQKNNGINQLNAIYPPSDSPGQTISFVKLIKDIHGNNIAVYFIDIDLKNTVSGLLSSTYGYTAVTILNSNNRLLYQNSDTTIPGNIVTSETDKVHTSDHSSLYILKKSKYIDWFYLFESSRDQSKAVSRSLMSGYLLVFSLTVLLCIIAIMVFPTAFSKRIKHFSDTINNIPEEDLASATATGNILKNLINTSCKGDEFDSIMTSFYNLFRKNTKLNTTVKENEIQIEKSKFIILQQQINPHFLYNSLDTIRICMLIGEKETACGLIQSLSQFYRISLSKGKDIITIGEELQMITSYLEIEKAGYDGKIKWFIHCPDEVSVFGIPKFTLQPIVENCIVHGNFTSLNTDLFISIKAECTDDIKITVEDNGSGITADKLEELSILLSSPELIPTTGYGLQNCCQRIRLHYGASYGITLKSSGKGTCTVITLPKNT